MGKQRGFKLDDYVGLVGDVHGKFDKLTELFNAKQKPKIPLCIVLGDVGIGFHSVPFPEKLDPETNRIKFIRGNHDNPEICNNHLNYLGNYGYFDNMDLFFISGAASIDKHHRTENVDWWAKEEIGWEESSLLLSLYERSKPSLVISHDCPGFLLKKMFPFRKHEEIYNSTFSYTNRLLDELYLIHKPKYWIFSHYHSSFKYIEGSTTFKCLNELEFFKLKISKYKKPKKSTKDIFSPTSLTLTSRFLGN